MEVTTAIESRRSIKAYDANHRMTGSRDRKTPHAGDALTHCMEHPELALRAGALTLHNARKLRAAASGIRPAGDRCLTAGGLLTADLKAWKNGATSLPD